MIGGILVTNRRTKKQTTTNSAGRYELEAKKGISLFLKGMVFKNPM